MLIIFATIGSICDPTGTFFYVSIRPDAARRPLTIHSPCRTPFSPPGALSPNSALIWLGVWRIILGIGVGGDYPMSASVATDRANLRRRGTLLSYIFANQGWGSFVGSLAFIIVLLCYKHTMNAEGHTSKVDGSAFYS